MQTTPSPIRKAIYKSPSELIELQELSIDIDYDIKYATKNNSFNQQMYPCERCLLRFEVAQALLRANEDFMSKGYHIKVFDCFRPISIQHKMWNTFPNPSYVQNPNKKPSMHNRGVAVDLTLMNSIGEEVNMGTTYDYFGKKAHQDYFQLPTKQLEHRKLLRETMIKHGFRPIRTEWWHYSYYRKHPVTDSIFNCD